MSRPAVRERLPPPNTPMPCWKSLNMTHQLVFTSGPTTPSVGPRRHSQSEMSSALVALRMSSVAETLMLPPSVG